MTFWLKSLKLFGVLSIFILGTLALSTPTTQAQIPDITIKVSDTTTYPNIQNAVISVYMDNLVDTIAGFNIWIQMDRPDIAIFQTNLDTLIDTVYWKCLTYSGSDCIDSTPVPVDSSWNFMHVDTTEISIGNLDTTGTLCSGWGYVDSRSLSGTGTDINIVGIANWFGEGVTPGLLPQQGGVLVRILADVFDIPDTLTDRTVNLMVQTTFKDHFGLSDPHGNQLTYISQEVEDTNCYACTQWIGSDCANYEQIPFSPGGSGLCDSIYVYLDTVLVLDTARVKVYDGSLTVLVPPAYICGNVDGSDPPNISASDILYLINYVFEGGPAPDPIEAADVDCGGTVNGNDVLYLINYMFMSGPAPCDGC